MTILSISHISICSTELWREISLRTPPSPPPTTKTYKINFRNTKHYANNEKEKTKRQSHAEVKGPRKLNLIKSSDFKTMIFKWNYSFGGRNWTKRKMSNHLLVGAFIFLRQLNNAIQYKHFPIGWGLQTKELAFNNWYGKIIKNAKDKLTKESNSAR